MSNLLNDLNSFINDIRISHPKVYDEVILMSEKSQVDFMFDFEGNKALLDQLDANPHLIHESWEEITYLNNYRKEIKFIKEYYHLKSNLNLERHIFKGELNPREGILASQLSAERTFAANGRPDIIKYESSGIHHLREIPDDVMLERITKGPNPKGYFKARVRKRPGNGWFNPSDTNQLTREWTIAKETTCFPNSWTKEKVKEEISFAISNKVSTQKINEFEGVMSDGEKLKIITNSSGEVISVYPMIKF